MVVIDNTHQPKKFHAMLGEVPCAVDFREVLLWQDKGKEGRLVKETEESLHKDDVINLQFTRSFSFSLNGQSQHTESASKVGRQENQRSSLCVSLPLVDHVLMLTCWQLTHHNLLNNGISIGRAMGLTEDDTLCNPPPLFHCFDK